MQCLHRLGSPVLGNSGYADRMTWRVFRIEVVLQEHLQNNRDQARKQARKRNDPHEYEAGKKKKYDIHVSTYFLYCSIGFTGVS